MNKLLLHSLVITFFSFLSVFAQNKLELEDVFSIQYANEIEISPDGNLIVYRKMYFDIMEDRTAGSLWIMNSNGTEHQKLTTLDQDEYSPKWSPSGDRIAFVSKGKNGPEIFVYWLNSRNFARLTQLPRSPSSITWSNNEKYIAFSMFVSSDPPIIAEIPEKPEGAKWAKEPRITDRLKHEADGIGYMPTGFNHLFVTDSNGGAIHQITQGDYDHKGKISWSIDDKNLFFSANRKPNWEYDFRNSEIYSIRVSDKKITSLTERDGPDFSPKVSPDGKFIAYLGFDDKKEAYQNTQLFMMGIDGKNKTLLSQKLDASISDIKWDSKGKNLFFSYDHHGNGKIGKIDLQGNFYKLADNRGGTSLGRPYSSGSYSISKNKIAYNYTRPDHPSDVAVINFEGKNWKRLTSLNQTLFNKKKPGKVEEIWYKSSIDGRKIQGWIVYPPNYSSEKKYPFLVENHGGPILNYGDRFSLEIQLYASAGYIVFYPNPRGSTGYGEKFANLLLNNYPGEDYQDVMDGVNMCIKKGIASEDNLFVAGGSAGGIMSAWMIGKNNRFEAAVVVKPVMNWTSKLLVADNYYGYANSRYPGQVWEDPMNYWKFSPISLVGNVNTPTLVMVGMDDLRTPPSEAKQLYHGLKLRKIPTVLVEIPEATHSIANRPSNLMTKIAHTIAWFNKYKKIE
tara:strand:- start:8926 stop:10956 length:2031 start_codon:yes stop_codon:yes gene_type:complete